VFPDVIDADLTLPSSNLDSQAAAVVQKLRVPMLKKIELRIADLLALS
jgi:hypothetical protein